MRVDGEEQRPVLSHVSRGVGWGVGRGSWSIVFVVFMRVFWVFCFFVFGFVILMSWDDSAVPRHGFFANAGTCRLLVVSIGI